MKRPGLLGFVIAGLLVLGTGGAEPGVGSLARRCLYRGGTVLGSRTVVGRAVLGPVSLLGVPTSVLYPPSVIIQQPPVYIEQAPPAPAPPPAYWYYCVSAQAYYPSVPTCPEDWVKVPPRP